MATATTSSVDFAFLVTQTFGDTALELEVLGLFVAQARKIVGRLPDQAPGAQTDMAHLLKGSARGIGAWAVAALAERYEAAAPDGRPEILPELAAAVAAAEAEITARLASSRHRI